MSQFGDGVAGLSFASPHERDRSQLPLWPELECELEQAELELALAARDDLRTSNSEPAPEVVPLADPATAHPVRNEILVVMKTAPIAPVLMPGEHRLEARAEAFPDADAELGQRLRAARERAGLGRDEVARITRITSGLIQAIEDGRFERLGATVFARGYLRSYARAVDLPDAVVGVWESRAHRVLENAPAPSLAATSPRRSSRQVASPIVYTLLTALIAVPAYYGVRQAQQSPLLRASAPAAAVEFDVSTVVPATGQSTAANAAPTLPPSVDGELRATSAAAQKADAWRQPVMASLTPMLGNASDVDAAVVPLDMRQVQVRLSAPSWIEIVSSDGRVIERSLLPAGSMREYSVPRSARVRIGDAGAVELRAEGKVIDLVPYTQANVATLTLDQAG